MLGKVISYAETRAAQKLALALERSHFGGMRTNRDYLISILRLKDFLKGKQQPTLLRNKSQHRN